MINRSIDQWNRKGWKQQFADGFWPWCRMCFWIFVFLLLPDDRLVQTQNGWVFHSFPVLFPIIPRCNIYACLIRVTKMLFQKANFAGPYWIVMGTWIIWRWEKTSHIDDRRTCWPLTKVSTYTDTVTCCDRFVDFLWGYMYITRFLSLAWSCHVRWEKLSKAALTMYVSWLHVQSW